MTITRRHLLQGGALAGLPAAAGAAPTPAPAITTLAGQTDDDRAQAHAWRDQPGRWDDQADALDEGLEDLLVVGAGISGLAGAWWFREHAGRPVRIRVLEAAAEPGGHARRNTFHHARSGRTLIGYGGSQSLDSPGLFSPAAHALLRGVGVQLQRFEQGAFDRGWHERHGLTGRAFHFGAREWGQARTVFTRPGEAPADWLARTPLGAPARAVLARLLAEAPHNPLPDLRTRAARAAALARLSYATFLRRGWGADAQVLRWFQDATQGYFGVGIDATCALDAWAAGLPGFGALDLGEAPFAANSPSGRQLRLGSDDYIYHFPDGNHGVVRALLRALRPDALPGEGMDALVDAPLDRARLDDPAAAVRVSTGATVVGLRHLGPPQRAEAVELRYLDAQGRPRRARARQVLLACWHRVIARLSDELPAAQRRALEDQVKVPLVYTTVLLDHWRPWQAAGVSSLRVVDGFWGDVALDFPVALGGQRPPGSADEPVLLHLGKVVVPGDGRPARAQAAAGRAQLLGWDAAVFEGEVRRLLDEALGAHGFDSGRDIAAVTVNRWAHGYAYEYMRPWDGYWPRGPLPCETARRGWGRVAIANSDAGAYAYAHSAIDQAARAVQELLPQARLPAWQARPGPAWPPAG